MIRIAFLFLFGFISFVHAQNNMTGIVKYTSIINNPDASRFGSPYKLYFDNNISFFEGLGDGQRLNENSNELDASGQEITSTVLQSDLPYNYYYTNTTSKELMFREDVAMKIYVVQDSLKTISWNLTSDKRQIGSYNCQKATAKFRGREWTVWFTPEIPVSHGPWKLRGLPGLILEASEASGKYEFIANKINLNVNVADISKKLQSPIEESVADMKTYITALRKKHEDLRAMILASMPRGSRVREGCDTCADPKNFTLEIYD